MTVIHNGMPIDDYHAHPSLSNSQLRDFAQSPYHYWQRHRNPDRPAAVEKSGQLEGNLAHCAILEPSQFALRYCVLPKDAPRRPTEAQWNAKNPNESSIAAMNWWREFTAKSGGKRVITAEQYEVAMRQAEAVRSLPEIRSLLDRGEAEVSAFWHDPATGVACRCRPDFVAHVNEASAILLDVKTFADASPDEFERQVARKGYALQDAHYSIGYECASRISVLGFVFVAVEDSWPYAASACMLDDRSREAAQSELRSLLQRFARCAKADEWPAYGSDIHEIRLPEWAIERFAE